MICIKKFAEHHLPKVDNFDHIVFHLLDCLMYLIFTFSVVDGLIWFWVAKGKRKPFSQHYFPLINLPTWIKNFLTVNSSDVFSLCRIFRSIYLFFVSQIGILNPSCNGGQKIFKLSSSICSKIASENNALLLAYLIFYCLSANQDSVFALNYRFLHWYYKFLHWYYAEMHCFSTNQNRVILLCILLSM